MQRTQMSADILKYLFISLLLFARKAGCELQGIYIFLATITSLPFPLRKAVYLLFIVFLRFNGIMDIGDNKMKIYLDSCCLSRPYDDLSQDRVILEADAVVTILSQCDEGKLSLYSSTVTDMELGRISDQRKREKAQALASMSQEKLLLTESAKERALVFQKHGIKVMDSLHLAVAETSGVDVFLTTDDAFLRAAGRIKLKITVANPVTWIMEVLQK